MGGEFNNQQVPDLTLSFGPQNREKYSNGFFRPQEYGL